MKRGVGYYLTYRQLAAWEPVLANFRAAAAAKFKANITYEKSSKKVTDIWILFKQPC